MKIRTTTHGIASEEGKISSDAFAVRAWDETVIAVLSDGAGLGEPARQAARRAVDSLIEHYSARPRTWAPQRALVEFTRILNRSLYQESQAQYGRSEMVATLAAAVIEGDRLFGVNIGDSRVCLWRDDEVQTLSVDHIEPTHKNMLTRALGMTEDVEPNVFSADLRDGDVAFLCSDGVSNHFDGPELALALKLRSTARNIVFSARKRASAETADDMSAVVLDIQETGKLRAMNERTLSIPVALKKGDFVDGYELIRAFHGTDRVWLADKDMQRVVIKFAPVEAIDSEQHRDAFTRETWNATRAQSVHFVRAYEPPGQTARYYVMEFVNAPSLHSVLQERVLSVDSAVALGKFLAEASHNLLRLDLAHGDIKPENILCVGDYASLFFKLVDLGSAAEIFSITSRAGTASYLAPERFHGAPVSERTEIFAIGVTMYQALTGRLPFGQIERFQTPAFTAPKRASKLNPNIPPWLDAVIARCLAINPARRYQHYSELSFDLAHPAEVQPFFDEDAPLLERNPLGFYKMGFFILLAVTLWLALKLLMKK